MNRNMSTLLNYKKALSVVKLSEDIWNNGDITEIIKLFTEDCVWRDNEQHIHGKEQILNYLQKKADTKLFYKVKAQLWSYALYQLNVSFYSEWQFSKNQQWFRSSGHLFVRLDSIGLIKEFCQSTNGKAIRVDRQVVGTNPRVGGI